MIIFDRNKCYAWGVQKTKDGYLAELAVFKRSIKSLTLQGTKYSIPEFVGTSGGVYKNVYFYEILE
jgi:hypothetical protein